MWTSGCNKNTSEETGPWTYGRIWPKMYSLPCPEGRILYMVTSTRQHSCTCLRGSTSYQLLTPFQHDFCWTITHLSLVTLLILASSLPALSCLAFPSMLCLEPAFHPATAWKELDNIVFNELWLVFLCGLSPLPVVRPLWTRKLL